MEHPGQPRVCAAGEAVELAPRDPDPSVDYEWSVATAPSGSTAELGDEPVQWFEPDVPGRYLLRLTDGRTTHDLTVRAFAEGTAPSADGGRSASGDAGDDERAEQRSEQSDSGGAVGSATHAGAVDDGEEPERPRVQLETVVDDEEVRIHAKLAPASTRRVEFLLDDRDDVDESDVTVEGRTLTIERSVLGDRARVYAVPLTDDAYGVPDAVDVRRSPPIDDEDGDRNENRDSDGERGSDIDSERGTVIVDRPYDPPSWALDSTIYEVYVRTFADADAERSQFAAIRERLDELDELGIDTLWLTPVLQHDGAPHGYNITDFFAIASDLGGREEYRALVEAAHDRDIRVLFDLVCNHSAREHPFFQDAYGDPDSPYRSWYEWQENGEPGTYFDWELIANFDFSTLAVRRHLLDVVDEWAPLVDGFRCDMAWAVPDGFWREVHDRMKAHDSEFFLLDETIPYIPDFQAGLFDMHFDSTTAFCLREVGDGNKPAEEILDAVDERRRVGFPDHASFMLYHENHDEPRYLASYGEDAAFASAGALATLPGAPMVYAGQETGQLGKRDRLDYENARDDLTEHYRRLLALRDEHPALQHRADLSRVDYDVRAGTDDDVVAYRREAADGEAVVVALNFGGGVAEVTVDAAVGGDDLVTGAAVGTDDGAVTVDDVVVVPIHE
ncbi:alpha-amylase MalA [Halobaculum rarum]|uniref:alpha-amylase MalA n=1 Tax=Halobaculum rarum TaxID=3075122 RepID=UPI0032AFFCA3